jgi:hypothetical protein
LGRAFQVGSRNASLINTLATLKTEQMKNQRRFYTYAYLRENGTPYYIGKGQTNRMFYKTKPGAIMPPKDKTKIIYLKKDLTEEEAFRHETYIISVLGRKDLGNGILRNRTNGGEGVSGKTWSNAERKQKSLSQLSTNNSFFGKTHTQEVRNRLSETHSKCYNLISPNGEKIQVKNLKQFCSLHNLDYWSMNKLVNGKYISGKHISSTYKGWKVQKTETQTTEN